MKPYRVFFFLFVLLLISPGSVPSQVTDCIDYSDYPHWVGQVPTRVSAQDVIVSQGLAYVADRTGGVVIADVSDPFAPVKIGELIGAIQPGWYATADALALAGDHLFVADGYHRQVHVLDVSDPTAPFLVIQIDTGVFPQGIAVAGDYLYVAVSEDGVEIYNISDPTAPAPAGFLALGSITMNVVVDGGLLFVNRADFGMAVCDLSDPTAPVIMSHVYRDHSNETWDVAVRSGLAYVSTIIDTWIVDVTDPSEATIVGSIPQPSTGACIDGDTIYLAFVDLAAYDLANPLAPVERYRFPELNCTGFCWMQKVAGEGGFAFLAADDVGLMIADLSDLAVPPQTATLALPATAERMRPWGSHLLVADRTGGLLVIDHADPNNPGLVGTLASEDARAVVAEGDRAYLADGGDGLKIVNLNNPAHPVVTGHYDTYSRVAAGLALDGGLVYLAADLSGLLIIDASGAVPTLVGTAVTPGRPQDVCLGGSFAFVAAGDEGLQVVDISDPAAPTLAASLALAGHKEAVLLHGETLFVGGPSFGVHAIDVTDPTSPEVLGWLPVDGVDLALADDFLYAAGEDGAAVIDCTDPIALSALVGFVPVGETCLTVVAASDHLLVAGSSLHLASLHCPDLSSAPGGPPAIRAWARLSASPNPFNPRVEIEFELERPQAIRLEVFDLAGHLVARLAEGVYSPTLHRTTWEGNDLEGRALPSGCYFLLLQGDNNMTSKKVMLVR